VLFFGVIDNLKLRSALGFWMLDLGSGMVIALSMLLLFVTVPVVLLTAILFVEIAAAAWAKKESYHFKADLRRPSIVVLVPARNESSGLLPTLDDIMGQLNDGDRLLVVADNCEDDTADLARAAGAEVVERRDLTKIGKGYALDFGLGHLRDKLPDVVIVVDADCRLGKGAITELALTCSFTGRPVQALYIMADPGRALLGHRVAEFAWRIKNDLRPRGLAALGLPCQLMGSGMAFPGKVIGGVDLATNHLAEDLALGLQLAFVGFAPLFCPAAVVASEFPSFAEAAAAQRQRWEHGHLSIIANKSLPYLWTALRRRNRDLLVLSLDAAVPPLVLLGLMMVSAFVLSLLDVLVGGSVVPLILGTAAPIVFCLCMLIAWKERGRDLLPLTALASVIPYIGSKFGLYVRAFSSDKKWLRTDRDKPDQNIRSSKSDTNPL
jgi:cellulose synthase/poly-beta-1,6-N-acetylglucosamine synthase-like glycosyltransferase